VNGEYIGEVELPRRPDEKRILSLGEYMTEKSSVKTDV
jgi:hypothetical protein